MHIQPGKEQYSLVQPDIYVLSPALYKLIHNTDRKDRVSQSDGSMKQVSEFFINQNLDDL